MAPYCNQLSIISNIKIQKLDMRLSTALDNFALI